MKLTIDLGKAHRDMLDEMAAEAGTTKMQMVEIAVYNLIALWMRERGKTTGFDAALDAGVDAGAMSVSE